MLRWVFAAWVEQHDDPERLLHAEPAEPARTIICGGQECCCIGGGGCSGGHRSSQRRDWQRQQQDRRRWQPCPEGGIDFWNGCHQQQAPAGAHAERACENTRRG